MIPIGWDGLLVIITVLGAWSGLLIGIIGWLGNRMFDSVRDEISGFRGEISELKAENQAREREHLELRALLPLQYVQREDWIRFSATLDAKLDQIRADMNRRRIGDGTH